MGYMARPSAIESRFDPGLLLPGCRTIISLAANYPAPTTRHQPEANQGSIATYALSRDYHLVLSQAAERLAQRIARLSPQPVRHLVCVDTAPLLEKDYAQQAGLGWTARNSLLTTQHYGSWIFLCEILIDLPLKPDTPHLKTDCAECQRCIMACPTKAILPNRSIDARRCLAYLTIEHRGPLPLAYRPLLGQRIFGCDTCQTICPSNRLANRASAFFDRDMLLDPHPDLLESFLLSEDEFRSRYRDTPVLRATYQGFRRNVATAIGNARLLPARPALQDYADYGSDPVVRDAAAWALAQF